MWGCESKEGDGLGGGGSRGYVEHAVSLRKGARVGQHRLETIGLGGGKIARLAGSGLGVEEPPRTVAGRREVPHQLVIAAEQRRIARQFIAERRVAVDASDEIGRAHV